MIELLSPGGDLRKIKTAINYGADAVYTGLKRFSLRSHAGNLDIADLEEAVKFVHKNHKKIYIALNAFLFDDEFAEFIKTVKLLDSYHPDAFIVSDLGAVEVIKEISDIPIHISTQANITNSYAAGLLEKLGIKRVVAAREMNIENIKSFTKHSPVELEIFVHGAMCMAYSGRCFMSASMTGRSANKGNCTQSCRWNYTVIEEKRPDSPISVEQNSSGSYIFNSRDLCALPILDKLIKAGATSFKIEGRMKSIHYVAVSTAVYRSAIDTILGGNDFYSKIALYLDELNKISHRPYSLGFFENSPAQYTSSSKYERGADFIAVVRKKKGDKIFLDIKGQIKPGKYQFFLKGLKTVPINIERLYTTEGEERAVGNPNDFLYIISKLDVDSLDILRKII